MLKFYCPCDNSPFPGLSNFVSKLAAALWLGIVELSAQLREKFGISLIYINHDLTTARYICDRIAIMYLGKIVEIASTEDLLKTPLHPYSQALIAAVPVF